MDAFLMQPPFGVILMKRYDLACFSLLASAFVLAGLLVVQLQHHSVLDSAHAEMVLNRGNLTLMTAQTRPNEEAVFVLENSTQKLLIYKVDATRKRIDLARSTDLGPWLRAAAGASTGGAGRTPR
jgi:hypothetical protein